VWRLQKRDLALIEDDDLTKLLKQIGRLDDLVAGKLQCSQCGMPLTSDNLSGFIVKDGEYQFFCGAQSCINKTAKS
jgi:hypothetical protein